MATSMSAAANASLTRICPASYAGVPIQIRSLAPRTTRRNASSSELRRRFSSPLAPRASASAAVVTEPSTGVAFPSTFALPGIDAPLTLLGTGLRSKSFAIISVKVYAVALYADPSAISASWKAKSEAELAADAAFFQGLAEAEGDKALIITLVRDVTSKQFVDALNEELVPKLEAVGADLGALGSLGALFDGRALKKDSAVVLGWKAPGSLQVSFVDDVKIGYSAGTAPAVIESRPLLSALFDLYLGAEPIAPSLPGSIAATVAALS